MDPKSPSSEDSSSKQAPAPDSDPTGARGPVAQEVSENLAEDLGIVFEDDEAMVLRYRRLQRRLLFSTIFSSGVVLLALGMMVSMFDDIRYWFQDDEAPQELALVDVLEEPEGLEPWRDHYVALSATPDASTAVKISLGREGKVTEKLRFFRLLEAGNRVFVQTDLALDGDEKTGLQVGGMPSKTLPGRFVGRVHRLGEVRFYESLRDHYNAVARPQLLNIDKGDWSKLDGEKNLGLLVAVQRDEGQGSVQLEEQDRIEVVVQSPEWMVQMGTKSWPQEQDAIARVKSLGLPFIHLPYKATPLAGSKNPEVAVQGVQKQLMHRFLVRPDARSQDALVALLNQGVQVPKNNASLEVGAAVLKRRRVYSAEPQKVWVQGETLRFVPQSKAISPGYEVVDGALVQKSWGEEGLSVALQEVQELRVKRPVMVTEDSLIVLTQNLPSAQWPAALAFGILGLFVVGNVVMARRFFARYQELRREDEEEARAAEA